MKKKKKRDNEWLENWVDRGVERKNEGRKKLLAVIYRHHTIH